MTLSPLQSVCEVFTAYWTLPQTPGSLLDTPPYPPTRLAELQHGAGLSTTVLVLGIHLAKLVSAPSLIHSAHPPADEPTRASARPCFCRNGLTLNTKTIPDHACILITNNMVITS